ncbi:DUF5684 domain-containing protein [Lentzea sp. BCCO 10_0061]|uniref:DUF5684 domain-containing protein n=1 Tax=Lentzea sokolovensis TaxID=3095429 RepID=A0ABU4UTW4_9PSEU|nr:DUF5684 domain-containing protein [Lentzea sp. BCCO 10_0061]MDX8142946.1 DUF5684 domain-containing protein [Lentzea sp. BCCO 10_0061]
MGTDPTTIDPAVSTGIGVFGTIIYLALAIFGVVVFWKTFTKAGQPGWAAIIPIYNIYVLLKVAGRPGWWLILLLIPIVNIVILAIVSIDVAKSFGKDTVFGVVGLWLFSIIGYAILAFGGAQYRGPAALAGQQAAYKG